MSAEWKRLAFADEIPTDFDPAGTDNSTDVTLVTTNYDYLSISGQAITLGQIDYTTDISNTPTIPVSGTDFDPVGTDNSTDVTLVTTNYDYLSITGQAITLGQIDYTTDISNTPTIPVSGTDFDPVGTDNSTDVTLVTTNYDYLSITGQAITLGQIDYTTDISNTPTIPVSGTDFDPVGTDNSTDVTLVTTSYDYLSISGQAITLGQITNDDLQNNKVTLGATDLTLGTTVTSVTGMTDMSGADVAAGTTDGEGGDLVFNGGVGTGTGVGGEILFKVAAPAAGTGNTQNTVATAITVAPPSTATGDSVVTIHGDLVVDGTNSSIDVQTLNVEDATITLADGGNSAANADGAGLIVDSNSNDAYRADFVWKNSGIGPAGWQFKDDGNPATAGGAPMGVAALTKGTVDPTSNLMPTGALWYNSASGSGTQGVYVYVD